jgi:hypothetical protein
MRYLLLSVLVVCMIGVMVPSAFAEFNPVTDCPVFGKGGMTEAEKLELLIQERECSAYPSTSEVVSLPGSIEPTGNLDKLIPEEYYAYDEQYSAYESPNPGENPFIELYVSGIKNPEVQGIVTISKYSSNDIAKQFANDLAMGLRLYGDVNLTYDSSCKAGVLSEIPALLCSKNDIVVYVGGYGNIGKLTTAILGNIKSSFMPIDPNYDPLFYDVMLYYGMTAAQIIGVAVAAGGGIIVVIFVVRKRSKTPKPAKQKPVDKEETSAFCENCGKSLKPTAKFCGGCGTARS